MAQYNKNSTSNINKNKFRTLLENLLSNNFHTTFEEASVKELYEAISGVVNMQLQEKRWKFNKVSRDAEKKKANRKRIYYISMEFLMGQSLKNNLYSHTIQFPPSYKSLYYAIA